MSLTRLLYFSENAMAARPGSTLDGLRDILATSNRNNKAAGITGALVFDDRWFLQALEGERAAVWTMLRRIEDDERHADVTVVEAREVEGRMFGNWWMGLATRHRATETVFAPFCKDGLLRPRAMTADDILGLMRDLSRIGLSRKLAVPAQA